MAANLYSQGIAEGAMESAQFWRDLAGRFRELQASRDPREQYHAVVVETTSDQRMAQLRWQERAALRDGRVAHAHEFSQPAVGLLEGGDSTISREYTLSGGPDNAAMRRSLRQHWSALASLGGMAAGLAPSREDALDAWLELLRQQSAFFRQMPGSISIGGEVYETGGGVLERLCTASVEVCLKLEVDAVELLVKIRPDAAEEAALESPPPPKSADVKTYLTTVGRNIDRLRLELGWTIEQLAAQTSQAKTTVIHHIKHGAWPQPGAAKVYADVFAKALSRPISVMDVTEGDPSHHS